MSNKEITLTHEYTFSGKSVTATGGEEVDLAREGGDGRICRGGDGVLGLRPGGVGVRGRRSCLLCLDDSQMTSTSSIMF